MRQPRWIIEPARLSAVHDRSHVNSTPDRLVIVQMTSSYNGPAIIVTADGTEFDVQAELATHQQANGFLTWSGYLHGDDGQLWDTYNAGSVTIRLPDGSEGTIDAKSFGWTQLDVSGSGKPPF